MAAHVITSIIAESDFTASGSSNSTTAPVILKNLDVGTSAGTSIQFKAADTTGAEYLAGELLQEHVNKTVGAQDSNIRLRSMQNGTLRDRMYINDVGVAFGVETAVTTIPTNKRFLVTDIPAPTFVSIANGVGVAFNGGGGIYMKNNTDNVEGKFEAFAGMIHLGVSGTVEAPVSFWTEGATERSRFLINGNFLVNRITDFNIGYKAQVEGSLFVRDQNFVKSNFEDFLMSSLTATTNPLSFVTGTFGTGSSGALDTGVPTVANYDGRVTLATGTTNNGNAGAYLNAFNAVNRTIINGSTSGKELIVFEWRVMLPVLSTAGTRYGVYVGFKNGVAIGDPTNGIYFLYCDNINSGLWRGVCRDTSAESVVNSAIAPVAGTWTKLKVEIIANNTVEFFIDEVSIGTYTGVNVTATALRPVVQIEKRSTSTTSSIVYVDYFFYKSER